MGLKAGSVSFSVLILLASSALGTIAASGLTLSGQEIPRPTHLAPLNQLGYSGIGPSSISLSWTESTSASFFDYVLRKYSNFLNEWETIHTETNRTKTSYFYSPLNSNSYTLWQVTYQDMLTLQYSNTLNVTQPLVASLSYTQPTATSVQFRWDNPAMYGGLVSFASYQLIESVNEGPNFTVAITTDVNLLSYTLMDMTPGTNYSFHLNTVDQCNSCSPVSFSSSTSNTVTINTPGPLRATIVYSNTIEVREPVSFNCSATGGVLPYTYSWDYGDGTTAMGESSYHIFSTPGTMTVVCAVIDTLQTMWKESIDVKVGADPSVTAFTALPLNLNLGDKVTFVVSTSGGDRALSYSYANLPAGCLSANATTISCTPTSSGNYHITVTVTDRSGESDTSMVSLTVGPQRVLSLPQAMGLAVIFGAIVGTSAVLILSVALVPRRKRGRQAPAKA
jgi:plastocyanin